MRWSCLLLLMLIISCNTIVKPTPADTKFKRSPEFQQEIETLIAKDTDNKKWARIYLHEIDKAMINDDIPAYVFFVGEFEQIPLEIVPVEFRGEPGYTKGPSDLELFFRLRWFEQAILMYKQQSSLNK